VQDLIRTSWDWWAFRYDVTWDEMFARLEQLVAPLKSAGWNQVETGVVRGSWDEDDFARIRFARSQQHLNRH